MTFPDFRLVSLRGIPQTLALLFLALFALPGHAADPNAIVELRLEVVDGSGGVISSADVGETVTLRVYAEDVRGDPQGVFAAYLDVLYDEALATAGDISYDPAFPDFRRGSTGMAGVVDDVGAGFASLTPPGGGERLVFSVPFTLTAPGRLTFRSDAADDPPLTDVLVYGLEDAVPVFYDTTTLTINVPGGPIDGGVAPTKGKVRSGGDDPFAGSLVLAGWLDLGSTPLDLAQQAEFTLGTSKYFLVPATPKGKTGFRYTFNGGSCVVKASKTGSSRAKFKLTATGVFDPAEALPVQFVLDGKELDGEVRFQDGKFKALRKRGRLLRPELVVNKLKGKLGGDGVDALKLDLRVPGIPESPSAAVPVGLEIGAFSQTVGATEFTQKGAKPVYQFKSKTGPVRGILLDHRKGLLRIKLAGAELGEPPEGASDVGITVTIGDVSRTLLVRLVRKGKKLAY